MGAMGSWRCGPAFGYLPWWDNADGEDLKAFMELFLDAWFDPDRHDVTRHVARHLIVAHQRGKTIQAKILASLVRRRTASWT